MTTTTAEWKLEPDSPLAVHAEEDAWLFFDAEEQSSSSSSSPKNDSFCSLTKSEIAQQLLDDIDNFVKEEENGTFSQWFEEKVDLPIFDELEQVLPTDEDLKQTATTTNAITTTVTADDAGNLTPPLSPDPQHGSTDIATSSQSFLILDFDEANIARIAEELIVNHPVTTQPHVAPDDPQQWSGKQVPVIEFSFVSAPPSPVSDLEREMAVVDEVVRNTAETLDLLWESEVSDSNSSSAGSVNGSDDTEESDDPEWVPPAAATTTTVRNSPRKATSRAKSSGSVRARPYNREWSLEDKRLRKKEQNKNAATRYRQRKKAEASGMLEEERMLEEKKAGLDQRVSDIRMEIKYLKGLMREMFKAKGLILN